MGNTKVQSLIFLYDFRIVKQSIPLLFVYFQIMGIIKCWPTVSKDLAKEHKHKMDVLYIL